MKRLLCLLLLYAAPLAFGQGACYPAGVVLLDTGRPANGAGIRVCTAGSTGTPCTPTASLFTDPTLGTPLPGSPVVTADAHGNFGFCAAAGNNYDLQISGTGITTLTIRNLPLPPTSPINAASLTSSSSNPANVGTIKLASGDFLDWRNNANTGNIQLGKTSSDQLDASAFSGVLASAIVSSGANPAQSGFIRVPNGVAAITARNSANTGDFDLIKLSADNLVHIPSGGGDVAIPFASSDTAALLGLAQTLSSKTLASPVFTGTASGTHTIPTTMLTAGPGLIQFGCIGAATSSASNLVLTFSTCAANTGFIIPTASTGTIKNLECRAIIGGVNASSGVMTVRKNIVATALTCTLGTATTCTDTTHSFAISPGDGTDIVFSTQAAETLNSIACTVEKGS